MMQGSATAPERLSGELLDELAQLERKAQTLFAPTALTSGRLTSTNVVSITKELLPPGGFVRRNPSYLVTTLARYGLAKPESAARSPLYALREGVNLILGCYLVNAQDKNPREAADMVLAYRKARGESGGAFFLGAVGDASIQRVERQVIPRLLEALVLRCFGLRDLPHGSVVLLMPAQEASSGDSRLGLEKRIKAALRKSGECRIGLVTGAKEIVLVPSLSEEEFQGRGLREFEIAVPEGTRSLVLAFPRHADEPVGDTSRSCNGWDAEIVSWLAYVISDGLDRLKVEIRKGIGGLTFGGRGADTLQTDILLWIVTKFCCLLASPKNPAQALCDIYQPVSDPRTKQTYYEVIATSDQEGARSDRLRDAMRAGQLMSGYASQARVTLGVPRSYPPRNHFISFYSYEKAALEKVTANGEDVEEFAVVAVPVAVHGEHAPVLYVWMTPRAQNEFNLAVRMLQVFAPAVGELLIRREAIRDTVRAIAETISSQWVPRDHLAQAIRDRMTSLVKETVAHPLPEKGDERLAFLVIAPSAGRSPYGKEAADWLAEQLPFLIPHVLFGPWTDRIQESGRFERPVSGQLNGGALVMIPGWLDKDDLELLRAALPSRLNSERSGLSERGEDLARFRFWVRDVKRSAVESGDDAQRLALAMTMVAEAERVATILDDIANAYEMHSLAKWPEALEFAKSALSKDPDNPYVLRRCAEYSLQLGDFLEALRYAEWAEKLEKLNEPTSSLFCLVGDCKLGTADFTGALRSYNAAIALDTSAPAGFYSKGLALLILATILKTRTSELALSGIRGKAPTSDRLRQDVDARIRAYSMLMTKAEACLIQARKLGEDPYEPVVDDPVRLDKLSVLAALAFLASMHRAPRTASIQIQGLLAGNTRFDVLSRMLMVSQISLQHGSDDLWNALNEPGVLDQVQTLADHGLAKLAGTASNQS